MDTIVRLSLIAGIAVLVYLWARRTARRPSAHGLIRQEPALSGQADQEHSRTAPSARATSSGARTRSAKATSSSGGATAAGTSASQQKTGKASKAPRSKPTQERSLNGTVKGSSGDGAKSNRRRRSG